MGKKDSADVTEKKQRGRPFVKGQSGNPKGRPEGSISLVTLLKQKLSEGDNAKHIIDATFRDALAGDANARKLIWDRIDGPVRLEVSGPDGEPMQMGVLILPSNGSE